MPFIENIGDKDRIIRAILAIIFLGLAVFSNLPKDISYFYMLLGAKLLATVLLKYSFLYGFLDFSTNKKERAIPKHRVLTVAVGVLLLLFALFVLSMDRQSAIDSYVDSALQGQREVVVAWLASGTLSESDYIAFQSSCSAVFTEYNNGMITDYGAGGRLNKAVASLQESLGGSFTDVSTLTYGAMTREQANSLFDGFEDRERVFLNQLLLRSKLDGWQIKIAQWYTQHTLNMVKNGGEMDASKKFGEIFSQFESDVEESA